MEPNGTRLPQADARKDTTLIPSSVIQDAKLGVKWIEGCRASTDARTRDALLKAGKASQLTDEELIDLTLQGKIPAYTLEKVIGDKTRAVKVRRKALSKSSRSAGLSSQLERLPWHNYDYERVYGVCCENVVGYMPIPLGIAGPITVDGKQFNLPMATTEGTLVASMSRGCKVM